MVLYVFKMHVKNGKKPTFNESALNELSSIFTVIYNKLADSSSIIWVSQKKYFKQTFYLKYFKNSAQILNTFHWLKGKKNVMS